MQSEPCRVRGWLTMGIDTYSVDLAGFRGWLTKGDRTLLRRSVDKTLKQAAWRAWLFHKGDRKLLRRSCGVRGWLTKGIDNYSADRVVKTA